MISIVLAALAAALALALGWFGSAWFHQRKINALRAHLKAVKETASEHSNQTRRQIAQLQAELETRRAAAGGFAPTQVIPAEGFAVTEVMS
jgi:uncharacterized protein HemX